MRKYSININMYACMNVCTTLTTLMECYSYLHLCICMHLHMFVTMQTIITVCTCIYMNVKPIVLRSTQ